MPSDDEARTEEKRRARERIFGMMEEAQARNVDADPDLIDREIREAIKEVCVERRARRAQGNED